MKRLTLTLKGMSCDHCVATVKKAVEAIPGVIRTQVLVNQAEVEFDETQCAPSAIIGAICTGGAFDVVSFRTEKTT